MIYQEAYPDGTVYVERPTMTECIYEECRTAAQSYLSNYIRITTKDGEPVWSHATGVTYSYPECPVCKKKCW